MCIGNNCTLPKTKDGNDISKMFRDPKLVQVLGQKFAQLRNRLRQLEILFQIESPLFTGMSTV